MRARFFYRATPPAKLVGLNNINLLSHSSEKSETRAPIELVPSGVCGGRINSMFLSLAYRWLSSVAFHMAFSVPKIPPFISMPLRPVSF
jgi:hypothetical protein